MTAMRLTVDNLAFGYRGRPVGSEVSFGLESGEVLCLLGPNGAGKTTLFKTVLRLLAPLAGTISIDAEAIDRWSRRRLARVFGYVPQAQLGLFPFTVRDVVLMGRTAHMDLFATPSARDIEFAEKMLDLLGIVHLTDHPYTEISGGERQLTLVARALAQEPKILVMDEPTASLDFGNQVRVLSEIKTLAGRGIAVILSTHDPDQAFLCAHRVAILQKGRRILGRPRRSSHRRICARFTGSTSRSGPSNAPAGRRYEFVSLHSCNPIASLRSPNEKTSMPSSTSQPLPSLSI
jgi:iron complex transport system ATP-binding protein